MYDFVYTIDFGNTSKTYMYYSCLFLNFSPMINSTLCNFLYKSYIMVIFCTTPLRTHE